MQRTSRDHVGMAALSLALSLGVHTHFATILVEMLHPALQLSRKLRAQRLSVQESALGPGKRAADGRIAVQHQLQHARATAARQDSDAARPVPGAVHAAGQICEMDLVFLPAAGCARCCDSPGQHDDTAACN